MREARGTARWKCPSDASGFTPRSFEEGHAAQENFSAFDWSQLTLLELDGEVVAIRSCTSQFVGDENCGYIGRLGVLENIFHAFGRDAHEIVFIFGCRLADQGLYERDAVGEILDDAGTKVMWRALDSFTSGSPLYPAGLADLLR